MPRRSRTPAAASTVGKTGQRTDMAQPPAAPTGMNYGAHKETISAQQAVPLAGSPAPAPPPPAPGAAAPGAPGGGSPMDRLQQAIEMARRMPSPQGNLMAPTAHPNEPVTSGLPSGPGVGPEALAITRPNITHALERMAYTTGDRDMALLAQVSRGYGI